MSHRCVPAPFLTKTYQLVEDSKTDDVVSWNEAGTTFVVWKPADFARDLLPNYFKHNNFSSFVRQLNTYAFRKIVPDRWEFANDNFKRGEKELLSEIHRRKVVHLPPTKTPQTLPDGKSNGSSQSPSNPSEDQSSSATSNPGSKSHTLEDPTTNISQLYDENEKLKKNNEILSSELAQTKKQCGELVNVLSKYFNVASGDIDRIMLEGSTSGSRSSQAQTVDIYEKDVDDDENGRKEEEGMKLFGVWLKGSNKKRGRDEVNSNVRGSSSLKEMKTMEFRGAPWMQINSSPGESSKVCN
ncbi:hypothetical protein MKW94_006776 [Papaver nudicaule]|uniref:HSF-type DNA-binding domain-containing protein n=1 Tax=Papaver nudicaule TaxID=74823 RepID=A0AA41VJ08_PAPNU|nr:hypothetical protein [Papaver nudicaule]